jgi:hypothetical protein
MKLDRDIEAEFLADQIIISKVVQHGYINSDICMLGYDRSHQVGTWALFCGTVVSKKKIWKA